MRHVWLLAVAACGRVGFAHHIESGGGDDVDADAAGGPQPIHRYAMRDLTDDFGGPDALGHGGTFDAQRGYVFGPNQGPSIDGALPQDVYTVDIEFAFADATGWRKIIDYEGLTQDSGFYTYDNALQYVIVPGSDFLTAPATFTPDAMVRVTLTRNAVGHVVVYRDGARSPAARATSPDPPTTPPVTAFEFDDPLRVAALTGSTVTFFIDDTATGGGEAASGSVRRITIYDVALTAEQVATAAP